MGKPQKRKNYHNPHSGKKARYGSKLDAGMRGILITCNKRERESVREAYNLLNEYADKLYGPEKTDDDEAVSSNEDQEEDVEAALQKEVTGLKKSKSTQRRFHQVDTGTTNVIFIRTWLEDPNELVHAIFTDTLESQQSRTRFILRMIPVLGTCMAYDDRLVTTATKLFEGIFGDCHPTTYASQIKVRNNTGVTRTSLLPVLGRVMEELNPNARVSFDNPEYIVNVDVLKTVACIGCLKDFDKFRKYNIQEVVVAHRTINKDNKHRQETDDQVKSKPNVIKETVAAENEDDFEKSDGNLRKEGEGCDNKSSVGVVALAGTAAEELKTEELKTEVNNEEIGLQGPNIEIKQNVDIEATTCTETTVDKCDIESEGQV